MPVLYGVFLYMGVAALNGMQVASILHWKLMSCSFRLCISYYGRHTSIHRSALCAKCQEQCIIDKLTLLIVKKIEFKS